MVALPDVDWSTLRTATGNASHIPAALRELCDPDAIVRQAAYWRIDNHAVLQSDLFEAAPFVVAGLQACLGQTSAPKGEIYELLVEFANGQSPEDGTVATGAEAGSVKAATTREIVKGVETYLRDLRHSDPATRRPVAQLLLAIAGATTLPTDLLREALVGETDEIVRECLREALAGGVKEGREVKSDAE